VKTAWPKHLGMTKRNFMRAKRKKVQEALSVFYLPGGMECDDDLMTGAAYLPDDVYHDLHKAYLLIRSAADKFKKVKC
jgi:hypothetical protein